MSKSFGRPNGGGGVSVAFDPIARAQIEGLIATAGDVIVPYDRVDPGGLRMVKATDTQRIYINTSQADITLTAGTDAALADEPNNLTLFSGVSGDTGQNEILTVNIDMTAGDEIPTVFATNVKYAFIEIDKMNANFNLSAWLPVESADFFNIRFRKVDASSFGIIWNDPIGIPYPHVDRRGEFISFVWDNVSKTLSIT
mgnify:CR=1 FL=1